MIGRIASTAATDSVRCTHIKSRTAHNHVRASNEPRPMANEIVYYVRRATMGRMDDAFVRTRMEIKCERRNSNGAQHTHTDSFTLPKLQLCGKHTEIP